MLIGPDKDAVKTDLQLLASFSDKDGGLIEEAVDVGGKGQIEKTLVLIKPDNFRFPSARPGNIIDLFSVSGLRIIGAQSAPDECGGGGGILRSGAGGVVPEAEG